MFSQRALGDSGEPGRLPLGLQVLWVAHAVVAHEMEPTETEVLVVDTALPSGTRLEDSLHSGKHALVFVFVFVCIHTCL